MAMDAETLERMEATKVMRDLVEDGLLEQNLKPSRMPTKRADIQYLECVMEGTRFKITVEVV